MNEESEKTNNQDNENSNREIKDEFSLSWLVVFCLLSPYLTINPGKRYEEVDGVRKEKERLTTDCLSYTIKHILYLG